MELTARLGAVREYLRGSLWFLPTLAVVTALVAGVALSRLQIAADTQLTALLFAGGADGARGVLEAIVGSTITVASVTFSLTVVALVNASSLYSPRVLRTFLRDRGTQVVLSTFLATFAYGLVVLRTIRTSDGDSGAFVPEVAVTGAVVLALASLAALVYFIHHITQSIRIETIITEVGRDTEDAIERVYAGTDAAPGSVDEALPEPPYDAARVLARRSGYLQVVSARDLVEVAADVDTIVLLRRAPGEHVTAGTVLAWTWPSSGRLGQADCDRVTEAVDRAIQLGDERTLQEDVAFGLRQLVDVAIKALSPSVNDPTTAVDSLGQLTVLVSALTSRRTGPRVETDSSGVARVIVPRPTFPDLLELACGQIAMYGAGDVAAVTAVLRLLEDVAAVAHAESQRAAVTAQIDRTVRLAERNLQVEEDVAAVRAAAERARRSLSGHAELVDRLGR